MDTPLVSVILATYNGALYIREALDSVLCQDYPYFELIIIDDASTDETPSILDEYTSKDSRIRLFHNSENLKLVKSLNLGISHAKGEYIARIDDDDRWSDKTKLSRQVDIFSSNPDTAVVGTNALFINDAGAPIGRSDFPADSLALRRCFALRNGIIHPSVLMRKSVIVELGGYREEWLYAEDLDLWLRVLEHGYTIANIAEPMIEYRVRESSTTGKKYSMMQRITLSRYWHESAIYPSIFQKIYTLTVRLALVILPRDLVRKIIG